MSHESQCRVGFVRALATCMGALAVMACLDGTALAARGRKAVGKKKAAPVAAPVARKVPAPAPAPEPAAAMPARPDPAPEAEPGPRGKTVSREVIQRESRIEFDERMVKGQTAAGAIYLFERGRSDMKSMITVPDSFRRRTVTDVFPEGQK